MADVDDEFLAIVGGDESSDEEQEQPASPGRSASGSPDPEAKDHTSSKTKHKSSKKRTDDSDEEEGEASSVGSPASQNSAPMDESDSESDTFQATNANGKMDDDDDNKYPVDGIYASEAEKEEILAMPELEREQLLARRQEEVDRQRQNTLLRRLLKTREDDSQSVKKRKASAADLDDSQRKPSRQRTRIGGSRVGETSAGIESLRRARAEKSDRQRRREEDRERNKKSHSGSRDSPSRGVDDDSDAEWAGRSRDKFSRSRTPEVKEIPLADIRDFERIRLGRSRFAQVCFYPGFDKAITGCYVRIALGPGSDGSNVYRMALIKGFTQGKPYAMEKSNGQNFVTDQYVIAAHGKSEREWPFISCSDSPFTEAEFNRYKKVCQDEGVIFPKRPTLDAKIDDINALVNRSWTDAEVNAKIERERSLLSKFTPTERNRLLELIEEAKRRGDDARVSELQDKLDSLETPRLAFKTSLTPSNKSTSSTPSQQERLAALNAENRRRNVEAVRKAQLMEKAKARQIEARVARGEDVNEDTSRRLRTKPKFRQDINGPTEQKSTIGSGASTPANGTPKQSAATKAPVLPHIQKLQIQNHQSGKDKKGIPQIHKPIVDDDIIAALDLDIEVEID
ncbi:plus-3-domain-containing protein [Daldinia caldariorum]|uniref:plus-3-domain-containing protein n=1 Tax=Daldinia caldariorum TaxID=326644 RepID=UPI00200871D7|nr:plus-3-domain-containing protein [Daldinia caldariorum]KAI1468021.1 plus-3-domain-containing protein [Daldinia caldariorum]